ncbi:hypothetical protein V2J09_018792 [Rumex salicifolius]
MGKDNGGNMKAVMMKGLCHSPSATAVCSHDGLRSVIVPRPGPTHAKYSRLQQPSTARPVRPPTNPKQGYRTQLPPFANSTHVFQVVVLRVSLHCQGCAGKVKKHLSKMEGVTSFSIDLEMKRVTVMGHVSPNGVLESISKVKRAEFWGC